MASAMKMVLCLMAVCIVVTAPCANAITCGQVASTLAPCIGYLTGGGVVPPACCGAVAGLNNGAKTTPDRQTVCGCLKGILASNSGINLGNVQSLPGKCGLNIPYKLDPATDCSKIQ